MPPYFLPLLFLPSVFPSYCGSYIPKDESTASPITPISAVI